MKEKHTTEIYAHDGTKEAIKEKIEVIIGWMHYGIQRGKTIPKFEDLIDDLLISYKISLLENNIAAAEGKKEKRDIYSVAYVSGWNDVLSDLISHWKKELEELKK